MIDSQTTIRVGTRGSLLARTQTEWILNRLRAAHPELKTELVIIRTTGDIQQSVAFSEVGTKGMFVKEIELALLNDEIDVGVHSLKDMPGDLPAGLKLGCIPVREDSRDALISNQNLTLEQLPANAKVGTSSIRRQSQLLSYRPDLITTELRGNLDTRLRKLDDHEYDAILLACAGLNRLGLSGRISQPIPQKICLPAVGQGALALETRADDMDTVRLLEKVHHPETATAVTAERGFQAALNGGCSVPAAAYAVVDGASITIEGWIAAPDGKYSLRDSLTGAISNAEKLGRELAERMLDAGGRRLLEDFKK